MALLLFEFVPLLVIESNVVVDAIKGLVSCMTITKKNSQIKVMARCDVVVPALSAAEPLVDLMQ